MARHKLTPKNGCDEYYLLQRHGCPPVNEDLFSHVSTVALPSLTQARRLANVNYLKVGWGFVLLFALNDGLAAAAKARSIDKVSQGYYLDS
jgi:hypothetical protein